MDPATAASIAIALEPTCWRGLGTVSRTRDHSDKKLQDYIVLSHLVKPLFRELRRVPERPGKIGFLLPRITECMMSITGTNLSFGSLFLLYYNVAASYITGSLNPDEVAVKAQSLIVQDDPIWYYKALCIASVSFTRNSKAPLYPDVNNPVDIERFFKRRRSFHQMLRLNINDPVSREAVESFILARKVYRVILGKLGCRIPCSSDIDYIHRILASHRIDYLVYRRVGLERAMQLRKGEPSSEKESMGSIADLTVLTLYYYILSCMSKWGCKCKV